MQAKNWAIRCAHEAKMHKQNCFVTLTYAPEHVPRGLNLDRNEFLRFLKNVKNQNPHKTIRYFHCGEYTKRGVPHYHAILFGHDFDDKKLLTKRKSGGTTYNLYTSEQCSKAWGKGFITLGEANIYTAGYIAKYCYKKVGANTGNKAPIYATMSRMPGIGRSFYEKFNTDIYPSDECRTFDGQTLRPPRYYDKLMQKQNEPLYNQIKAKRIKNGKSLTPITVKGRTILVSDNDTVRLKVKEFCKMQKAGLKNLRQLETL